MKALRAEDLRHRITIRRFGDADNGRGGYTTGWSTIASPWANVTGLQGREILVNKVLQGISVYQIRIWYREGITTGDQIWYGALDLNIKSCTDPDGGRRELLIVADTEGLRPDPRD